MLGVGTVGTVAQMVDVQLRFLLRGRIPTVLTNLVTVAYESLQWSPISGIGEKTHAPVPIMIGGAFLGIVFFYVAVPPILAAIPSNELAAPAFANRLLAIGEILDRFAAFAAIVSFTGGSYRKTMPPA